MPNKILPLILGGILLTLQSMVVTAQVLPAGYKHPLIK